MKIYVITYDLFMILLYIFNIIFNYIAYKKTNEKFFKMFSSLFLVMISITFINFINDIFYSSSIWFNSMKFYYTIGTIFISLIIYLMRYLSFYFFGDYFHKREKILYLILMSGAIFINYYFSDEFIFSLTDLFLYLFAIYILFSRYRFIDNLEFSNTAKKIIKISFIFIIFSIIFVYIEEWNSLVYDNFYIIFINNTFKNRNISTEIIYWYISIINIIFTYKYLREFEE
ncbi:MULTISPECIES: hypothetical protein [Oceanotoga]|uniref:Uncharacterized protein n=1 Tax=Oceanotoga teriensis TaxID=515440 RepID=A0AA45C6B5_9BACT|nr:MULTISPECIES: hypothetical protein [Oceanotoga]MDN5343385.1 hypothetical protein [Oceanotoga sp.]PWJ91266.1 hypothetical protein C7380_11174 [Oceanotoga teriensis]